MLHFKHIRSGQFKGMNPIDLLRNSIEYDQSVRQISLNQLRGSNEVLIVTDWSYSIEFLSKSIGFIPLNWPDLICLKCNISL